jgi:N-acetylglucosamine kinase-like BadF-type ATPase
MKVILAIDGGGSRTRCLAIDQRGHVVSQAETGPSNHLVVDEEVVARSLAEAIDQALKLSDLSRDAVACVSAGLAGVDSDGAGAGQMDALLRELGFENLVINGDMIIAHAGALRLRPGVVALAGTGSVVLGVGADGKRVKVGGWGPVYGDEGSAYRIGEMSLRAAARAYDSRGPATALMDALLKALGLNDFKETLSRVYVEGLEPREIAALSRIAYDVAEAGDEVAREIFFQAGDELAESVEATVRQLTLGTHELVVSHQGSVVESCRLLRERFIDKVKRRLPNAIVVAPEFEPVIGAYLLGCKTLGWEVDTCICTALKGNQI